MPGAGALAGLVTTHRELLIAVVGWVVVAFGVVQILGGGWSLRPAARVQQRMAARGTAVSTVGLGAAYGLAGFCSGPSSARSSPWRPRAASVRGAALLAVYAVGMTVPLFLLALLWQRFDLGRRRWLRGREFRLGPLRLHTTSTISGLLFVGVGLLFLLADGTAALLGADPAVAQAGEDARGAGRIDRARRRAPGGRPARRRRGGGLAAAPPRRAPLSRRSPRTAASTSFGRPRSSSSTPSGPATRCRSCPER